MIAMRITYVTLIFNSNNITRFIRNFADLIVVALLLLVYLIITKYNHSQRMTLVEQPLVNDFILVDYRQINPSSDIKYRYLPLNLK